MPNPVSRARLWTRATAQQHRNTFSSPWPWPSFELGPLETENLPRLLTPENQAPLDPAEYLQNAPSSIEVRGLYFDQICELVESESGERLPKPHGSPFGMYPHMDFLHHLLKGAKLAFPHLELGQALRQVGRGVYDHFYQTMPGRAIFSFTGGDIASMANAASKGYAISLSAGTCKTRVAPGHALAQLRNIWGFPSYYHVGVWEGAIAGSNTTASVRVRQYSLSDVNLHLDW